MEEEKIRSGSGGVGWSVEEEKRREKAVGREGNNRKWRNRLRRRKLER